jgi:hypothetical protein
MCLFTNEIERVKNDEPMDASLIRKLIVTTFTIITKTNPYQLIKKRNLGLLIPRALHLNG